MQTALVHLRCLTAVSCEAIWPIRAELSYYHPTMSKSEAWTHLKLAQSRHIVRDDQTSDVLRIASKISASGGKTFACKSSDVGPGKVLTAARMRRCSVCAETQCTCDQAARQRAHNAALVRSP